MSKMINTWLINPSIIFQRAERVFSLGLALFVRGEKTLTITHYIMISGRANQPKWNRPSGSFYSPIKAVFFCRQDYVRQPLYWFPANCGFNLLLCVGLFRVADAHLAGNSGKCSYVICWELRRFSMSPLNSVPTVQMTKYKQRLSNLYFYSFKIPHNLCSPWFDYFQWY